MNDLSKRYVAQRQEESVVYANYPGVGRIYLEYYSNNDCNAPPYYGFTLDINGAARNHGLGLVHSCTNEEGLIGLAQSLGIGIEEAEEWANSADWVLYKIPGRYYAGYGGFISCEVEWSENPAEAILFGSAVVDGSEEPNDCLEWDIVEDLRFVEVEEAQSECARFYENIPLACQPSLDCYTIHFKEALFLDASNDDWHIAQITFMVVDGHPSADNVRSVLTNEVTGCVHADDGVHVHDFVFHPEINAGVLTVKSWPDSTVFIDGFKTSGRSKCRSLPNSGSNRIYRDIDINGMKAMRDIYRITGKKTLADLFDQSVMVEHLKSH